MEFNSIYQLCQIAPTNIHDDYGADNINNFMCKKHEGSEKKL